MLVGSGHDLEHLLSTYSWDQLALQAKCVILNRVEMLNMIASPLVQALGGKYKPGKFNQSAPRSRNQRSFRMADHATDEAKENGLLRALGRVGVRVRSAPSVGDGGGS